MCIRDSFYYEGSLHAVGLRNRFDWPTNTAILKLSRNGKVTLKHSTFDRNVVKAEVNNSLLYFLYEDSGKTLLRDGTNNIDLIDAEVTVKDFAFNNDKTYVIANSFSKPVEVYELNNGQLEKTSQIKIAKKQIARLKSKLSSQKGDQNA